MALNEEQRRQLKELQRLEKEPAAAPVGKVINVTVDLGNDEQVARAIKHGFLTAAEVDEDRGDGESDEDADDAPRRKGYFNQ